MPFKQTQHNNAGTGRRGRSGFNWMGAILLTVGLILIAGALFYKGPADTQEISPSNFLRLLQEGKLSVTKDHPLELLMEETKNIEYLSGYYKNPRTPGNDIRFRTPISVTSNSDVLNAVRRAGLEPVMKSDSNLFSSTLLSYLPIAMFLLLLGFALVICRVASP